MQVTSRQGLMFYSEAMNTLPRSMLDVKPLLTPCTLCSGDQGARLNYNGDGKYWCQDCHFHIHHSEDVSHIAADRVYEQTSSDGTQWAVVVELGPSHWLNPKPETLNAVEGSR